jgi:molecular chaperone GrpE
MENERHRKLQLESERADRPAKVGTNRLDASAGVLPEDPEGLASAYEKLLQEKQELYERLLRRQAELENFRKRMQRDKEDFSQHATAELMRALLPTLDAMERALKHRDSIVPEQFHKGIEIIYKQLSDVLGRAGLAPVETAGRIFDPHLHHAVETVESPAYRDQEIVEELQKGYEFKQRLLRPALVRVSVGRHDSGTDLPAGDGNGDGTAER